MPKRKHPGAQPNPLLEYALDRRACLAGAASLPFLRSTLASAGKRVTPSWVLRDDGTFDLEAGSLALRGCFPGFDESAIHPQQVIVVRSHDGGTIQYKLLQGTLTLELGAAGGGLFARASLSDFSNAPHHVFPIASAQVIGASRFFRQGLGFGGPSGIFPIPEADRTTRANFIHESAWSYDSYLMTALLSAQDHTLAVAALEHGDYLQRTTLYDRTHRYQLIDKRALIDTTFIECGFATERLPIKNRTLVLPALHILVGETPMATLQELSRQIAKASHARTDKPPRFHWDTWYEYLDDYDLNRLTDALSGLRSTAMPMQGLVIDAGYCPLGDWTIAKPPRWPGGLPAAFDAIKAAGFVPGAYVSPFMISSHSDFYKKHPDAVMHDRNGVPMLHGKGKPIIDTLHPTEERYFLDTSHPVAFEHVRQVFRQLHAWGARFYKTDFWEWGFKDSTEVKRHTPGKTSVQYLVDVIRMVREEIGEASYFMGCIAPLAPFIGYVDSMRVGYDTDPNSFNPEGNMVNMFNETNAGQYFNNIFWQNDPDVVSLRGTTNPLDDVEIKTLAYWSALTGGVIVTSDRLHLLWPHRLKLLWFIKPGTRQDPGTLPFWSDGRKELVVVRRYEKEKAWALLVVNPTENDIDIKLPLSKAIGRRNAFVFAWEPGAATPAGQRQSLDGKVGRHGNKLYYLSETGAPPPADLSLAGERLPQLR
jgi:Melibiase